MTNTKTLRELDLELLDTVLELAEKHNIPVPELKERRKAL